MNTDPFSSQPSSPSEWFTAHCDGGSRGNPGPAGYGAVVQDAQGRVVAELSDFLGIQTNNYAEYSGLLALLRWALETGARRLRVIADSELMVKQMQGKYKVASPVLRPLYEEARSMARKLDGFEMQHTLRGGNKHADRLANEAMDRGMGRQPGAPAAKPTEARPYPLPGKPVGNGPRPAAAGAPAKPSASAASAPAKAPRQTLDGYVKDGVVHLLGGELPDGCFVKIVRE